MTDAAREAFHEAVALQGEGELEEALAAFQRAHELAPTDTEIAYRTASALLQTGRLDEAQSQLRRIVFASPQHLQARASLGNCQLLVGDIENAKQNFEDVLSAEPDNRNALYGLTRVFLKTGFKLEATHTARRLQDLMPGSTEALTLYAESQQENGQDAAAIATYRQALRIDAAYIPALLGLARCLLLSRRYDEALAHTLKVISQRPTDPAPLAFLCEVLTAKGQLEDARQAAESALDLSSSSVQLRVQLSVLCRRLGDNAAALKYALAGYDLDPGETGCLKALGAALAAMKHTAAARDALTGQAAGRTLDPTIRTLVEKIVADADAIRPIATGPTQTATRDAANADAQSTDPAPAIDPATQKHSFEPSSAWHGSDGKTDHATAVPGLQRRDKS